MNTTELQTVLSDSEALSGFSRLSIAMVITNPKLDDNPIIYVNDAFERTTGYSRSSVIGRNCRFLQGERTDKRDVDHIRSAVDNARDVSVDILNYRSDGSPFYNRLIIAPIMGDGNMPVYFLGIQKELVQTDRGADNRIASENLAVITNRVHRDLAMILKSVSAFSASDAQSLAREVEALPRRLECLQLVYEEMKLSDKQRNREKLDLGSLLSRIASSIAHHEGRAGVRFTQHVEQLDVNLETAARVALVMSETLNNAFRHAFTGLDQGYVELRATRLAAGGMRLMIADDGVGIPERVTWPDSTTIGGRLIGQLLEGLDATINIARGAAGTIVTIDVPVGFTDN